MILGIKNFLFISRQIRNILYRKNKFYIPQIFIFIELELNQIKLSANLKRSLKWNKSNRLVLSSIY